MSDKEKDSYFSYLKYIAPFGLFVSFLYNLGYWRAFGINIYQYAGLSDLVSSTVLPLTYSLILIAFSFGYKSMFESDFFNSNSWKSSVFFWITIAVIVCLILYFMFMRSPWFWVAIYFGHLSISSDREELGEKIAKERDLKVFIGRLLFVTSLTSYTVGLDQASDIVKGVVYTSPDKTDDSLRFVGKAGEFYFFFDPITHAVSYENIDQHKKLTLYPCFSETCNHTFKKQRACLNLNEKQSLLSLLAIKLGWKVYCTEPEPPKVDVK